MAIIIVATAYPAAEHREEVIAAFEAAIGKVHAEEDGCELYALHEGPDGRLVMIEKYASDEAVAAHRAGSRARRAAGGAGREAVRPYGRAGPHAAPGWLPRQGGAVGQADRRGIARLWLTGGSRRWRWRSGARGGGCPVRCTARWWPGPRRA